jgi:DNA-binding transcriptional ArsR family regulator
MVEYTLNPDSIFSFLAASTRCGIIRRITNDDLSVGEIAEPYNITFTTVAKHLKVLERTRLIVRRRHVREQIIQLASSQALNDAMECLSKLI